MMDVVVEHRNGSDVGAVPRCKSAGRALALTLLIAIGTPIAARAADCSSTPAPETDWTDCSKKSLVIQGSDLTRSNLTNVDLTLTDLRDSNLTSANLEKANLVRASLKGVTAEGANFTRVEAYRTNFAGISANKALFVSAELQRANFDDAKLAGANFEKAELARTDFRGADLTGARFSLSNLSRADLTGATVAGPIDFDRAFMFLTRLDGLDLSGAKGLEQAQIDLACGNADTKLPEGLTTPTDWPCTYD